MSRHHRKPKSKGGKGNRKNISIVPEFLHKAWHALFKNLNPKEIANIINETWIDPEYRVDVKKIGRKK